MWQKKHCKSLSLDYKKLKSCYICSLYYYSSIGKPPYKNLSVLRGPYCEGHKPCGKSRWRQSGYWPAPGVPAIPAQVSGAWGKKVSRTFTLQQKQNGEEMKTPSLGLKLPLLISATSLWCVLLKFLTHHNQDTMTADYTTDLWWSM